MPRPISNTDIGLRSRRVRRRLLQSVIAGGIAGGLLVAQCGVLGHALARALEPGTTPADLIRAAAWLLALAAARLVTSRIGDRSALAAAREAKDLSRDQALTAIWRRHVGAVVPRTGELLHTLAHGLDDLDSYVGRFLPHAALAALVPLLVLVSVAWLDPLSGVVLAGTGPLMPLFMWLAGSAARRRAAQQWTAMGRLSARFLDAVRALGLLIVSQETEAEAARLEGHGKRFTELTLGVLRLAFVSSFVLELVATLGVAVVSVEVGLRLLRGSIEPAAALTVLLLAPEFYRPLRTFGASFHAGQAGREASRHVRELVVGDSILPLRTPRQTSAKGVPEPVRPPSVSLHQVCARYGPQLPTVLRHVSMEVPAGSCVALVGPSGAGKSTVVQLVLGFLSPETGNVRIDGIVLGASCHGAWRRRVAWIPQQPSLFPGSVRDNIRLARPDATTDEMWSALGLAGADTMVRELPHGLDTRLGDHGERLSTGQVQRIAIARAFLKDAPMLVLDEPTSFLDPDTDAAIERSLVTLRRGRTTLLIAHRLSSLPTADVVVVLDRGTVVEQGSYAALLAQQGHLASMLRPEVGRR